MNIINYKICAYETITNITPNDLGLRNLSLDGTKRR